MAFGIAALLGLGACGKRYVTKPVREVPPECRIVTAWSDSTVPITFALLDPVDLTRAPWAGNEGERIVFGHLYETLITIDCEGGVRPGLAEKWTGEEGGRRWNFELRKEARFWNGARVTARDVVESWQDALTVHAVIDSVSAMGERTLRVWMKIPHGDVPRVLSASVFAVTKPDGDSRWLMGTGPYRVGGLDVNAFPSARRTITLHPALGGSGPLIRFVEATPDRARDLLEGAIDVMVTADPSAIEYATGRSQFLTVALPWQKTYVLLSASRVRGVDEGAPVTAIPFDVLRALARDAVRGDARGYEPTGWWDDLQNCAGARAAGSWGPPHRSEISSSSNENRRILYDASDTVARGLAERIAALAAVDTARSPEARHFARAIPGFSRGVPSTMAEGMSRRDFEQSLRRGDEFAYVVSLPRETPDPCREWEELGERAPWIMGIGHRVADALIPLVDTRSHLIARKEAASLIVDGYGSVVVMPERFERGDPR